MVMLAEVLAVRVPSEPWAAEADAYLVTAFTTASEAFVLSVKTASAADPSSLVRGGVALAVERKECRGF